MPVSELEKKPEIIMRINKIKRREVMDASFKKKDKPLDNIFWS
jgi:hypothetical protein